MEEITAVSVFEKAPWLEVPVRRLYYGIPLLQAIMEKKRAFDGKKPIRGKATATNPELYMLITDYIESLPIKENGILIVHSSTDALAASGMPSTEWLQVLLTKVGPNGTLAMPAFPMLSERDIKDGCHTYDPKRAISTTGLLPNLLVRKKGAIRSEMPANPLAAYGPCAFEMMRNNLNAKHPHGEYSSWAYCYQHDAAVLYLGLDFTHCATEIHIAEELFEWPVPNWFTCESFYVKTDYGIRRKNVEERTLCWRKYLTEYRQKQILLDKNLVHEEIVDGVRMAYMPSIKATVDFIRDEAEYGRLISYKIPKRLMK